MADDIEAIRNIGGTRHHGASTSRSVSHDSVQTAHGGQSHSSGSVHGRDSYAPDPDRSEASHGSAPSLSWAHEHKTHGPSHANPSHHSNPSKRGTSHSHRSRRTGNAGQGGRASSRRRASRADRMGRAARSRARRGEPTGTPHQPVPADTSAYLQGKLASGVNPNRITNLNGGFARDLAGMLKDLQGNHGFNPRITSGWRPEPGSNHSTGMAADITAANRTPISNSQLKMIRSVAAQHGLRILDERTHGYNKYHTGPHLHVSRTGR